MKFEGSIKSNVLNSSFALYCLLKNLQSISNNFDIAHKISLIQLPLPNSITPENYKFKPRFEIKVYGFFFSSEVLYQKACWPVRYFG